MRYSWMAALAVLPLLLGAGIPPTSVQPSSAAPAGYQPVGFFDRLLEDGRRRPTASTPRRGSAASRKRAAPALPSVGPIPLPKPAAQDEAVTSAPPAPSPTEPTVAATGDAPAPAPGVPPAPKEAEAITAASDQPAPTVMQPGTATEPAHSADVPKPLAKPETADHPPQESPASPAPPQQEPAPPAADAPSAPPDQAPSAPASALPATPATPPPVAAPTPLPAPARPEGEVPSTDEEAKPVPPPIADEDPAALQACLADLTAIGAKYQSVPRIDDGEGCGIDKPVEVAEVLPGVALGGAVMRCQTALSLAHWLKDTVQPALTIAMPGRRITGLEPGSTYACRLRNGASTGRISEHARGNAFDVAAFKLDDGTTVDMKPRDDDHTIEGAFQKTATAGACLHFTTVLAPGSDAAHETHLHLDIMGRDGGYRICE